jgi:hypothetical protein
LPVAQGLHATPKLAKRLVQGCKARVRVLLVLARLLAEPRHLGLDALRSSSGRRDAAPDVVEHDAQGAREASEGVVDGAGDGGAHGGVEVWGELRGGGGGVAVGVGSARLSAAAARQRRRFGGRGALLFGCGERGFEVLGFGQDRRAAGLLLRSCGGALLSRGDGAGRGNCCC